MDGTNIYCSYKCRNIYVNKNLRNYTKISESLKNKGIKKYKTKSCKYCGKEIEYEKRRNTFCNHSCSAAYNNDKRVVVNKPGVKEKMRELAYNNFFDNAEKTKIEKKLKENIYKKNPLYCDFCGDEISYIGYQKSKNRKCCSKECSTLLRRKKYSESAEDFKIYRSLSQFKFNLKDYGFDFNLVEKHGWYSAKNRGDNVDGVSRDHMFSVKEGFRRLVNPLLLAHPANCQLIVNRNNQSKCDDCSITIEELEKRIKDFDKKYGKYYKEKIKKFINISELKELFKIKLC